jgi:tetratricopeptide (TPR) repeat protein
MELAEGIPDDPYLYGKSGFGKAGCLAFQGKAQQARRTAELVLAYGHKNNNSRCLSLAYSVLGDNEYYNGNSRNALEIYEKSIASSPEPMYRYMSSTNMSAALIAEGRLDEAEKLLNRCEAFFSTNRGKFFTMEIKSFQALLLFRKSQFSKAFRHLKGIRTTWNQAKCFYPIALVEYTLGTIYLEMLHGNTKVPLSVVLRNLSFIVANAPFAYRRAKQSFERSYEVAKAHGIFGIHGRSALELGVLLKARNPERAGEYLHEALEVLRKTDLLDDIERAEREIKKQ